MLVYSVAFVSAAGPGYAANPFTVSLSSTVLNTFTVLQNTFQPCTRTRDKAAALTYVKQPLKRHGSLEAIPPDARAVKALPWTSPAAAIGRKWDDGPTPEGERQARKQRPSAAD